MATDIRFLNAGDDADKTRSYLSCVAVYMYLVDVTKT
jgi:hypothetical protein